MGSPIKSLRSDKIIGQGVYGVVYLYNSNTCVKVNKDRNNNLTEVNLYKQYAHCPLFPRIYEFGDNYIVMEYIQGRSLKEFLEQGNKLNTEYLDGLIKMFEEGYKIGLKLNPNAKHVIMTPNKRIRLVDLDDIVKFASSKPFMLFHRLAKYGQKSDFIQYVNTNNKQIYHKWMTEEN